MITMMERTRLLAWLLVLAMAGPLPATAQTAPPPPPPPAGSEAAFTPEQLEQVAAPIALYPDPLLAQVLMASTYPLEVVQAARFLKANPNLKGDQLNEKLKEQTWDDSVKSLVSFPQVLDLMNEKLDWTQKLGDAFLADEKALLDAVQRLRARAQAQGNLKSSPEQTVTAEPAPAAASSTAQQTVVVQQQPPTIIKIEPSNPDVVYVPSYNPTVVYGAWPYPAYPPYYPYPPGYAFGTAALSFGIGMAVGAAVWGNCNWGGGHVDVDVNRNTNFSRNVNRTEVANNRTARVNERQSGNRSQWQHNPENRRGVQYRDQATQQRYNRGASPQAAQSREAFRGRAEQGRQDLSRGGGGSFDGGRGQGPGGGQGRGGGQGSFGGRDAGAFQGMGSGGDIRGSSSRGQASRESMGASRGGGGARAGGGGISAGGRGGGGGGSSGGGARGGGGRGGGGRGGRR